MNRNDSFVRCNFMCVIPIAGKIWCNHVVLIHLRLLLLFKSRILVILIILEWICTGLVGLQTLALKCTPMNCLHLFALLKTKWLFISIFSICTLLWLCPFKLILVPCHLTCQSKVLLTSSMVLCATSLP